MNKTIFILALLVLTAFSHVQPRQDDFKALWGVWKSLYSKTYGLGEDTLRYQIFVQNFETILRHNRENHSYELGLNQFADLTLEEFKSKHLGFVPNITDMTDVTEDSGETEFLDSQSAATTVDWRTKGVVTIVKNQGSCGSCWAFASVGAIESALAIKGQALRALSPQQLVDCSRNYGNQGCNGGLMIYAYMYVKQNGIARESSYPYKGVEGTCQTKTPYTKITGYKNVAKSTSSLTAAVTKTPISVGIAAGSQVFQHYKRGILTDASSCGTNLDHAGVIVGYTGNAFIFKNSWGTTWGESGYMRLGRKGDVCGITKMASYPTL